MSNLKPCHICGADAKLNSGTGTHFIYCSRHSGHLGIFTTDPFVDDLILRWNNSYVYQEIQKRDRIIEKLVEELKMAHIDAYGETIYGVLTSPEFKEWENQQLTKS